MKPRLWVAYADAHYPKIHRPTWNCFLSFVGQNPVEGVVDLGDTVDNACISRHTKGKPGLRKKSEYKMDTEGFFLDIIDPLEAALARVRKQFKLPQQRKIRLIGNHCDWEREYYEENPELTGMLDRSARLADRGWEIVQFGKVFREGKLSYTHGEMFKGKYHANNALDTFCRNILYAHYHTVQVMTKVLSTDQTQKWMSTCSPIVGSCNPEYMENRPNAWVNGFNVIEYWGTKGLFNLYPVIVTNGQCTYGGRVYG